MDSTYQLIQLEEVEEYNGEGGYFYRLTEEGEYFKFHLLPKPQIGFYFQHRYDLEQCLLQYFSKKDVELLNRELKNNFNPAIHFIHEVVVPGIIKKHREDLIHYASIKNLYRKTYISNDKNNNLSKDNQHHRGQGVIFN